MRMMLKAQIPNAEGNAAITDNTMGEIVRQTMERTKPEACYFGLEDGLRTAYMVFDLDQVSNMVPKLEPLFLKLGCRLYLQPGMTPDDLAAGFAAMH